MKIFLSTGEQTYSYDADKDEITIGRSDSNDFKVGHKELSRNHCIIFTKNNQIKIRDVGSKNGIYVDGLRVPAHEDILITIYSEVTLSRGMKLSFFRLQGQTHSLSNTFVPELELEAMPLAIPLRKKR